jgi:cytochrome oxidase Cu insertion factor (SCO1/SenC/PrrC family)
MTRSMWIKVTISLFFIVVGIAVFYQTTKLAVQPLPVYMSLPAVNLIDQDGRTFDISQTRGKIVVLSPIYTHCTDICPLTTAKMKLIQEQIKIVGLSNEVQLITFTVDPERDSPEVLKQYSGRFNIDSGNWIFLTGSSDQIQKLIKGLSLYVERVYDIGGTAIPESALPRPPTGTSYDVNHTDCLFIIDRQGNVRALPPGSQTNVNDDIQLIQQIMHY